MNEKLQFIIGFVAGCITAFMICFLFLPKIFTEEPRSIGKKVAERPKIKSFEQKDPPQIATQKRRPTYRRIDFHQHQHQSADIFNYFKVMRFFNVEKGVILALRDIKNNNVFRENNDFLLKLQKRYPSKIIVFTTIQEEDSNSAEIFEEDIIRGSRGLKLIGWHKAYIEKYDFSLIDKKMYRLYELCDQYDLPILAHIRLSYNEEYYKDLAQILSDFKNLKIILAHAGITLDNLTKLDHLMRDYPNLNFDLSFYGGYNEYCFNQVSRNRDGLRSLILRYPDRVLWGTDVYPSKRNGYYYMIDALRCSIDLVEKESFICPPFRRKNRLRGLALPGNVLEKIYYKNAEKLLNLK